MVIILLGTGFEEAEALVPADFLRRAGLDVKLMSVTGSLSVTGGHAITVNADGLIEEAGELPEAIVLPGGLGGVESIRQNPKALEMIKACFAEGKRVAAICAAPTILSSLGILKGKNATCYPDMKDQLADAAWLNQPAVTDGSLTTSMAAGTASEFAFELIRVLRGEEAAQKVKNGVYFPR